MLSLASASKVIVHPGPTDMRLGVWGLSLKAGPLAEGEVHCFCSSDRRSAKLLVREGLSLWVLHKRLERGRFQWPSGSGLSRICVLQLQWLLDGPGSISAMEAAAAIATGPARPSPR
jgi:transposase